MPRILLLIVLLGPYPGYADNKPDITDLAWMTGAWSGPMGEQTLEENWLQPGDGTMVCVVRMTAGGKTNIYELIAIEEEADTLMFRVRQWRPGFKPLDPPGQTMVLAAMGNRTVSFKAVGPGNFQTLSYSRPVDDQFHIAVETQEGSTFTVQLARDRDQN